jgi:hypothetical protein
MIEERRGDSRTSQQSVDGRTDGFDLMHVAQK